LNDRSLRAFFEPFCEFVVLGSFGVREIGTDSHTIAGVGSEATSRCQFGPADENGDGVAVEENPWHNSHLRDLSIEKKLHRAEGGPSQPSFALVYHQPHTHPVTDHYERLARGICYEKHGLEGGVFSSHSSSQPSILVLLSGSAHFGGCAAAVN
jgi:hypothetical protein